MDAALWIPAKTDFVFRKTAKYGTLKQFLLLFQRVGLLLLRLSGGLLLDFYSAAFRLHNTFQDKPSGMWTLR